MIKTESSFGFNQIVEREISQLIGYPVKLCTSHEPQRF